MACPAATWLSTGMSDEGERGHLQRQESRLRRGLIKISLHQECKQQRKRDRKGEKKKKMILHFVPYVPPLPSQPFPPGLLECWQIDLLCRLCLLCILPGAAAAERGNAWDATSRHRGAAIPRGVSTASRLFSQVPVNPVSPMNWSAAEAGELTSIRVTHPTQRWCLRVQFIRSRGMEAEENKSFLGLIYV